MEVRILGALEVVGPDGHVALTAPKQRALITFLALHAGEVVSTDRLIDGLWDEPPKSAKESLENVVGRLRHVFGADVIATRPGGYALGWPSEQVDAVRFERLLARARAVAETSDQRALLSDALALWRGPALADLVFEPFVGSDARRLDELRLEALERRIAVDLEHGLAGELVAELDALVREHPLHEGLRESLMIALYRGGRQAEALEAFHDGRRIANERLGIAPGQRLQEAYRLVLRQELDPGQPAARRDPDHAEAVVDALLAGGLVVALGPATNGNGDRQDQALSEQLARRFSRPADRAGDLSRVCEYVALTHGVGPLYDELRRLHDHDDAAGSGEQALAVVTARLLELGAPPPLFVTAAFGEGARAGADPRVALAST